MSVKVRERARERERERGSERERKREGEGGREGERARAREICHCPGQRSCSLNKRFTIAVPTYLQKRERECE